MDVNRRQPSLQKNYNLISGFLKSDKLQKYTALEKDEDKIKFLFEHEAYWPILQNLKKLKRDSQGKDKQISKSLRDAGNEAFKNENDGSALDYYNQAILLAPCDSNGQGEDLAIAVANRAAVLLRQEKFTYCLSDLELASVSGYPVHLRHKLLQRHAKTLTEMYRFQEAEVKFKEAIQAVNDSTLMPDQKSSLIAEMTKCIAEIGKKDGLEKAIKDFMKNPSMAVPVDMRMEKLSIKPNKCNPSFSRDLEICENENKETIIKAKHDVNAGVVVALEAPLSHLLHPGEQLSHCCQCIVPVVLPVPCQGCIDVVYCSAKCRDYAWNLYHKYECSLVEASEIFQEEFLLAFRIICQKKDELEILEKEIKRAKVEKEDVADVDEEEALAVSTMCALLTIHLKEQNFFEISSKEISKAEISMTQLLRDFVELCRIRSQSISEVDAWDANKGITLKSIGTAYYSFLTNIKHSCEPNTARCNLGTSSFLITTKIIPKDEDITFSYNVNFQNVPSSDRSTLLWENFKLHCQCRACEENWPTSERLTKTVIRKGMEKFVADLKRNYAQAVTGSQNDLKSGYYDKVFESWSTYYDKLNRVVHPPHQGFLRIAREIENCAWLKYGNHRPKLKAPIYKDHTKAKPEDSDGE